MLPPPGAVADGPYQRGPAGFTEPSLGNSSGSRSTRPDDDSRAYAGPVGVTSAAGGDARRADGRDVAPDSSHPSTPAAISRAAPAAIMIITRDRPRSGAGSLTGGGATNSSGGWNCGLRDG